MIVIPLIIIGSGLIGIKLGASVGWGVFLIAIALLLGRG